MPLPETPRTRFVRSSSRTKPDPMYYKRKVDRWTDRRNFLLDVACAVEEVEPDCREAKLVRQKADRLTAQIRWGHTSLVVAQGMQLQAKKETP